MADVHTPEIRSKNMAAIRSKNTKAEVAVFKYLRQQEVYFQKHYTKVIGKPDIALPRKKRAVFVDGDFWHGRTIERVIKTTKNPFWIDKITRNIERDKVVNQQLDALDWEVLRVWESDLKVKKTQGITLERIKRFLLA